MELALPNKIQRCLKLQTEQFGKIFWDSPVWQSWQFSSLCDCYCLSLDIKLTIWLGALKMLFKTCKLECQSTGKRDNGLWGSGGAKKQSFFFFLSESRHCFCFIIVCSGDRGELLAQRDLMPPGPEQIDAQPSSPVPFTHLECSS